MFICAPKPIRYERKPLEWRDGFNREELKKLVAYCETLPLREGTVGPGVKSEQRNSKIAWIPFPSEDPESKWIYERIMTNLFQTNAELYGFDLCGLMDNLQYTVYDARDGESAYYGMHWDYNTVGGYARKLSMSMLLSDPRDYEGGDLILDGFNCRYAPKELGIGMIFPSFTQHRVTPVTKGVRRSLVAWVAGEDFR